jgi:copper chaperone
LTQHLQFDTVRSVIPPGGIEMTELTYAVPGISCEHCRHAISTEVGRVPGVGAVEVDLERKVVVVRGDALPDDEIRAAIDEAGYDIDGPAA